MRRFIPQFHDGPLAELLLNLAQGVFQRSFLLLYHNPLPSSVSEYSVFPAGRGGSRLRYRFSMKDESLPKQDPSAQKRQGSLFSQFSEYRTMLPFISY